MDVAAFGSLSDDVCVSCDWSTESSDVKGLGSRLMNILLTWMLVLVLLIYMLMFCLILCGRLLSNGRIW